MPYELRLIFLDSLPFFLATAVQKDLLTPIPLPPNARSFYSPFRQLDVGRLPPPNSLSLSLDSGFLFNNPFGWAFL